MYVKRTNVVKRRKHVSNKLLTNHHPSDDDIARSKDHIIRRYDMMEG